MQYKPLQDHIIVELLPKWEEETTTKTGIVLLEGQKNISQDLALVLEAGPGLMTPQGLIPMTVNKGDVIALHPLTVMKSFIMGSMVLYTKASNVLFIIEGAEEAVKELKEKNKDKIKYDE